MSVGIMSNFSVDNHDTDIFLNLDALDNVGESSSVGNTPDSSCYT